MVNTCDVRGVPRRLKDALRDAAERRTAIVARGECGLARQTRRRPAQALWATHPDNILPFGAARRR
jgi:hypothetical protein